MFSTSVLDIQHGRAVPERTVQAPTLDGPNTHFGRAKLPLWTGLGLTKPVQEKLTKSRNLLLLTDFVLALPMN